MKINNSLALRFSLLVLTIAFLFIFAASANAATNTTNNIYGSKFTWPAEGQWKPLNNLNDSHEIALANEAFDFVGDATDPGAFYYNDGTYIYFRIRMDEGDGSKFAGKGTLAVLIDNTNAGAGTNTPDFGFAWDAKMNDNTKHGFELLKAGSVGGTWETTGMDDIDNTQGDKTCASVTVPQQCDFAAPTGDTNDTADGFIRTIDNISTTSFGITTFVDFAAKWAFLDANTDLGNGNLPLRKNQIWRIALASINQANDTHALDYDIGGNALLNLATEQKTLSPMTSVNSGWSDSFNTAPTLALLAGFQAKASDGRAKLMWRTASELNVLGFNIWRAGQTNGAYKKLNAETLPAKNIGQMSGADYRFVDHSLKPGKRYFYKIEILMTDGQASWSEPQRVRIP